MTAAPPCAFRAVASADASPVQHGGKALEESFQKFGRCADFPRGALTELDARKAQVIAALWRAFPEAASEHDLASRAAPYFRRDDGSPIEPRTVRLWLSGVSLPRAEHVLVLIGMVGAGFFGLPMGGCERRGVK